MKLNTSFLDASGARQQVHIGLTTYREAEDKGMSLESYVNSRFVTAEGQAPAFRQICAQAGLIFSPDRRNGLVSPTLKSVLDGTCMLHAASDGMGNSNTMEGTPISRILFPAAVLAAVEDKLARDLTTAANAFDSFVAYTQPIQGKHFTRVVTNYDKPEAARNRATAQLARPQNFALLTASERPGVVPTVSLGLEWSDEVAAVTTLDFIALSLARQVSVQRNADAHEHTIALLDGDADSGQGALPAAYRSKASDFDADLATAPGTLSQEAWVKWLYKGSDFRTVDTVITDIDGALAIQNRKGAHTVVGDDGTSPRIDTKMKVANPVIPDKVDVFITNNPDWPAGTILGFMKSQGIQRVVSLSANYQAVEQDVIRRANAMRWDSGSIAYRLYDESFHVLELL